jgi:hypothetical protein
VVITLNIPVKIITNMMDGKQKVCLQGRGVTACKEIWRRLIQGIPGQAIIITGKTAPFET